MVPRATFSSYYGRPVLKPPVWKDDIAYYFFLGGLAAGCSLLGAGADQTGRVALRRGTRLTALGALGAGSYYLIHDLGRPERFHHMLRVAKPTSPMSMGTWALAAALAVKMNGSSGCASCQAGTAVCDSRTAVYDATAGAIAAATRPAGRAAASSSRPGTVRRSQPGITSLTAAIPMNGP